MDKQQLPPLPKPALPTTPCTMWGLDYYTADQMRDYARAALEGAWRPVETAPTGEIVFLIGDGFAEPHRGDWGDYVKHNYRRFTHWMPLPQPPKEGT